MSNSNRQRNEWSELERFQPYLVWLVPAVLLLFLLYTSIYTVQAESQGVVLRFGQYIKTVEPGLRFKLPFGIDQVSIIPVRRQLKQEFGFGTEGGSNPTQFSSEQREERSMVTGDLNTATVEWVVQYRIDDPKSYLIEVREPGLTLRDLSESVMRTVVGDRTVDEVITIGRQEIEVDALVQLQELVNKYELGLSIDQVQLKNVNPPLPVQPSFNEVNQAQQEREQMINVANGEYNKEVPRARGEARTEDPGGGRIRTQACQRSRRGRVAVQRGVLGVLESTPSDQAKNLHRNDARRFACSWPKDHHRR